MKFETSAGGIIFSSTKPPFKVLLLKDKNNQWTFPKGLVEKDEYPVDTAVREIAEEVGLQKLQSIAVLDPIRYFYKWEGRLVNKKVQYYVFIYTGRKKPIPQTEEGIMEVRWIEFNKALKMVGYKKTNQKLLKEAKELISTNTSLRAERQ